MGSYELQDNLVKAVEYTNEIIIELLPKVYDTERQEMILNPDGTEEIVYVNKEVVDRQTGDTVILNDLSLGNYGVLASNGANYKTKRIEAANTIVELRKTDPIVAQTTTDLLLDSIDSPISGELSKRARKIMLAQGFVEPSEEEIKKAQESAPKEPSLAEQMQIKQAELEIEKLEFEVGNLAAEQDLKELQGEKLASENEKIKAEIAKVYAETNKTMADANKNSQRETPSEFEAQEMAADAVNTTIEENFSTNNEYGDVEQVINQVEEDAFIQPENDENLQNQEI